MTGRLFKEGRTQNCSTTQARPRRGRKGKATPRRKQLAQGRKQARQLVKATTRRGKEGASDPNPNPNPNPNQVRQPLSRFPFPVLFRGSFFRSFFVKPRTATPPPALSFPCSLIDLFLSCGPDRTPSTSEVPLLWFVVRCCG